MSYTSLSKKEVITLILEKDSLIELLNLYENPSIKGFMYELIAEFAFAFGQTHLHMSEYEMYFGRSDLLKSFEQMNIDKYFEEKAISGNSGGVSDITYLMKKTDTLRITSVKYFQKEKSTTKYDISAMYLKYQKNNLNKKAEIQIICNDKEELQKRFSKASSENQKVIKTVCDIYDCNDVSNWFLKLKVFFENNTINQIKDFLKNKKPTLQLRPHQFVIAQQVKQKFEQGVPDILINGIPRCGKTYISGGIITDNNFKNVLFITPRPTDCRDSYLKMFNEYKEFVDYSFEYKNDTKTGEIIINTQGKTITILSRQLIIDRQEKNIDLTNIDLVIFDEAHYMCTKFTKNLIQKLKKQQTKIIYMTGTSQKVEDFYRLTDEKILRYGLKDIINFKDGNIFEYDEKLMNEYLEKYHLKEEDIIEMYRKYPEMKNYICSLNNEELSTYYNEDNQFSWKKLFALNKKKDFKHKGTIKSIMSKLFGLNRKEGSFIETVKDEMNNEDESSIILTFLPYGQDLGINNIQDNLEKLLKKNKIFNSRYEIVSFSSLKKSNNENILDTINQRKQETDKDLIVLVGSMLELGCSIPEANIVITMHDFKSSDKYIQQIYRCLTENKGKLEGAVIDFNPHRVLYNNMKVLKNGNKSVKDTEIMDLVLKKDMIRIIGNDFELQEIEQSDIQEIYENINELDLLTNSNIYNIDAGYIDEDLLKFTSSTGNYGEIAVVENISKEEQEIVSAYNVVRRQKTEEEMKQIETNVDNALQQIEEMNIEDVMNGIKNMMNFSMITME